VEKRNDSSIGSSHRSDPSMVLSLWGEPLGFCTPRAAKRSAPVAEKSSRASAPPRCDGATIVWQNSGDSDDSANRETAH